MKWSAFISRNGPPDAWDGPPTRAEMPLTVSAAYGANGDTIEVSLRLGGEVVASCFTNKDADIKQAVRHVLRKAGGTTS